MASRSRIKCGKGGPKEFGIPILTSILTKQSDLAKAIEAYASLVIDRTKSDKLSQYRPYGHPDTIYPTGKFWKAQSWHPWSNKPWQADFHRLGKSEPQRLIMGGNRSGKSLAPAMEVAIHMTGRYPDWWEGRVFSGPVSVWTGAPTNATSKRIIQRFLLGGLGENLGTGSIPRDALAGKPSMRQCGLSDVVDSFRVRHVDGGISECQMLTYQQTYRVWQGGEPHVIWMDEQPDRNEVESRILTEATTRILTSRGILMASMCPLEGDTEFTQHFLLKKKNGVVTVTWDDIAHLSPEEKQAAMKDYPEHELQARVYGVPMVGEGLVFTDPVESLKVRPFEIPEYFAWIKGIDFGINHPAAVADIAWDRDEDIIFVVRTWRKSHASLTQHTEAIRADKPWVPVAWPHDGQNVGNRQSLEKLSKMYRDENVKMLSLSARYKDETGGAQAVEPIIQELSTRMKRGEFKVFENCNDFFDEYRNLHRKNGVIVALHDDVIKAVCYATMMKRYAKTRPIRRRGQPNNVIRFPGSNVHYA